jgi:hypothetical protein
MDLYLGTSNSDRAEHIDKSFSFALKSNLKRGLSVVILNLDKPELIIPLITRLVDECSLFSIENLFFEVIVGDTGSTEPTVKQFYDRISQDYKFVKIVLLKKYHFSQNNNEIIACHAEGEDVLFLNNDVIFREDEGLLEMYLHFRKNGRQGVWGRLLLFADQTIQHAGVFF